MLPSNIKYIQELDVAKEAIKKIVLSSDYYLGTDTETTGLDPHTARVRLVQIATDDICYEFDVFDLGESTITKLLNYLLEKVKGRKCFVIHNFKFDVKMFWSLGIDFTGQLVYDTMLASAVINCGLLIPNDLLFVADRFLGIELDKTEQKSGWDVPVLSDAKIIYAANDVLPLKRLVPILDREIANEGLEETFKLEMRAVYGFAEMEYFGVKLDTERLSLLKPIYEEKLRKAKDTFLPFVPNRYIRKDLFGKIVDEGMEFNSPIQVLKVLRALNIPNPLYNLESKNTKDHDPLIPSTGADMVKLLDVVDYPVIEALLEIRKVSKLLSSYVNALPNMVNPKTGRVHCHFNQMMSTGRSSASNPGLNQLPRPDGSDLTIRSCFITEPGNKFVLADQSQIELRIVAQLCKDENMLTEFKEGKDPYASTAALLNNLKYENIVTINPDGDDKIKPEYKKQRQQAKAVRLGFNYCVAGYTKVTTAKGLVPIKKIKIGDIVLTHKGNYKKVIATQKVKASELVRITTNTGKSILNTVDHKMMRLIPENNNLTVWTLSSNLKVGDYLIGKRTELYTVFIYTIEKIIKIEYITVPHHLMWDITVEDDHSFIANGLVSHNCMWYIKFRNYAKQQYNVTFTLDESKKKREKYFESYPGLTTYHNLFIDKRTTEARTLPPFNRKRKWEFYPGVPALSNHPSQGTGGDIQKLSIATIYEELHRDGYSPTQSHDCRLVLTVHDELEIEVKEEIAEYARELLQRNMVEAGEFVIKDCPIKAEADIVDNLAQKS